MRQELRDRLCDKYPVLYKDIYRNKIILGDKYPNEGFYCGDGWYILLDTLSALIFERDPTAVISEINKDSYGNFQVYVGKCDFAKNHDYIYALIGMANHLSKIICEKCGNYVRTCREHHPNDEQMKNIQWRDKSIELPFKFKNTGKICNEMSRIFFESALNFTNAFDALNDDADDIESKNGKPEFEMLVIQELLEAQLYLLLTFANKINPTTDEIIKMES
ncbi:MAG: hypothetical protein ACXVA2_20925 [Mucilaginibacter sp.]